MVLLGNKGDMVHLRQVSSEEGDILAKDFDCNFREVAAADQVNEVNIDFSRVLSLQLSLLSDCGSISRSVSRCSCCQEEEQNISSRQSSRE